ncbi:MAG: hypothetical protein ACI9OJ_003877 [Myxococcota bacterium]|jgi:hypothetical protein
MMLACPSRLVVALALMLLVGSACDKQSETPSAADTATAETTEPNGTAARPVSEITDITPGAASMRRLTRGQYIASVRAVFGDDLPVLPSTEIDLRAEGLVAVGAREASVTPAGIEGYEASARQVAVDVMSPARRDLILTCTPVSEKEPDDSCAAELVRSVAPLLLRRVLVAGEEQAYVALARTAPETFGDFHRGLQAVIVALMLNPEFLFIHEATQPAINGEQGRRLKGESVASRLSYFFRGRGPDRALIDAAAAGELDTEPGYLAQVERLTADTARIEQGIRALFTDLYDLDELHHVEKDRLAFPELTQGALEDAREQTLRTIVDHLLVLGGDYRDLFTTRKTFMTRRLGPIYGVPVAEEWEVQEFPENRARAGILTNVSFLALNARTSRSSPVLRGEFVMDKILCLTIPPPPADVNFDAVAPGGPTPRPRVNDCSLTG